MRIGIATRDWSVAHESLGGSGYYRCALPAKVLANMGHDVVLGTLCARDRPTPQLGVVTAGDEQHWDFDVVLLQRWMFDGLPERILRSRAAGQVVLNDVDDWWEGLDPSNLAWYTSHARTSRVENRDHYRRVLAASTAIVCSTPFLVDRYARLASTVLVRNVLDLDRWTPQEAREGPPIVGWVGALPWRSKGDVEALAGFLGPFLERHDLVFHHAGAMAPGWDFALAARISPHRLRQSPLVPIEEHERQFDHMDVALVPMANKPFNEAKSAIKGLQAAAAGVPFVASAMPEYRWLREERRIGLTARNPRQWISHLERLLDPRERALEALGNSAYVQGMGLPVLARSWELLLSNVAPREPTHA